MMLWLGVFLILFTTFLYLLHYAVRGGRKGELIDKMPGPYAWPFIGNIVMFMVSAEELWKLSRKINKEYYPINRIWSVKVPVVNVFHPDDVEALLSNIKHIEKSMLYNFLHPWLNNGLLTSKGEKWRDRRRILTPAFHFNVLRQFVQIFVEQSEKLVKSICLKSDEEVHNIIPLLHNYTLNSICETAMGSSFDVEHEVQDEYRSCVTRMVDIMLHRLTRPWLHMDWSFKWSKRFKDQVRALKVLHGFSKKIIKERKQYHEETDGRYLKGLGFETASSVYGIGEEDFINGKRRLAMLDLLISASKLNADIDDEGIREEVDTFIFEGHDTTAMALAFTILLLAENKDAQDKARAEVDEKFDESEEGKLTWKDIQSFAYLERCIKESLRLFPSVPFISRHISEDLRLKNYVVPGGTVVHVHIFDVHRDPNFWPNPLIFDPDRFLPDQVQGRHPFAFVPFSAGPRNCIGQKFAMLELKSLIGYCLRTFYFEPVMSSSDVRIYPDLVLRPITPIRVKLVRRSHN